MGRTSLLDPSWRWRLRGILRYTLVRITGRMVMLNGIHLMFHVEGGKAAAQVGRLSTEWRCGDCMISSGGWSLVSGVPDLGTKSRGQRLGVGLFVQSAQIRQWKEQSQTLDGVPVD